MQHKNCKRMKTIPLTNQPFSNEPSSTLSIPIPISKTDKNVNKQAVNVRIKIVKLLFFIILPPIHI